MLQRQDKYLLHSCNSRLLYQTCGNGFALGSYGILYSANIFFLSRDPAGSWFQLHFLSRVQWNPGSCVKCCLGIQVTHPFLSFNNMSYEESMLDKLTSLAWRGLSNAADAKKKNEKKYLIVNGQLHKMSFPWPLDVSPRSSTLTGRKISNRLCLGT